MCTSKITAQSQTCKMQQCETIPSWFSMPQMGNGEQNYVGKLYRHFRDWKGIFPPNTKCLATAFSRYLSHNYIYPKRKLLSYDHYVTPAGTPSCKFKNRNCEIKLLVCGHMGILGHWQNPGHVLFHNIAWKTAPVFIIILYCGRVLISRLVTKLGRKLLAGSF